MTRDEANKLLDAGKLYAAVGGGKWWRMRRNGRTITWKRRPDYYEIPIKVGLKNYARFGPSWVEGQHYQISEQPPGQPMMVNPEDNEKRGRYDISPLKGGTEK